VNLGRSVEFLDLLEQAHFVPARADHLGTAVANGAVDDPRADGVHPFDLRQVDGQRIRKRVDLALRGCRARDRERTGHPVHRTVGMPPVLAVVFGH